MNKKENKICIQQIEDVLGLIKIVHQEIKDGRKMGYPENDLMIRQTKYRKHKYTQELLSLLK